MPTSPTKPSTPRLSEVAQHLVLPAGVVSTGWPAVQAKCRDLGIGFDAWQDGAGRMILAKRQNGRYAATIGGTGLSIPRQVGKTFLVGAIVFALCLLFPGLTVIWTAHRLRTADETFAKMLAMSRRKKIAPFMLKPSLGSGEQEIRFRNGSRIMFGARERGFGRGFDEVDVLIFDEAQILTDNALDDMVPATNQSRQLAGALLLFMGTPPKDADPSEVFSRMRSEALSGEDEDTGWLELSADPGYKPSETPAPMTAEDWRQIAKANPSYPRRTPREAILRMRKQLTPESMSREGYGIWADVDGPPIFPHWPALTVHDDQRPRNPAFAVETTQDQSWTAICLAGTRDDDRLQVEVADYRPDSTWAIARVLELREKWAPGAAVVIDPRSPAGALIAGLEDAGVTVVKPAAQNVSHACATFYNLVTDKALTHRDEKPLNDALRVAKQRTLSDAWAWDRKAGNVAALYAATLAAWAARFPVDVLETIW